MPDHKKVTGNIVLPPSSFFVELWCLSTFEGATVQPQKVFLGLSDVGCLLATLEAKHMQLPTLPGQMEVMPSPGATVIQTGLCSGAESR